MTTTATIDNNTTALLYEDVVALDTSSAENIIGNNAGSGKTLLVTLLVSNRNGSGGADATIDLELYNQDGSPILSDVGDAADTGISTGTDVVGGSSRGFLIGAGTVVPAQSALSEVSVVLAENRSIVATAGTANALDVDVQWKVVN